MFARDKVNALFDVSVFTHESNVPLGEILTLINEKLDGKTVSVDISKASPDELCAYLAEFLPNFDRKRVSFSDIKKLLKWYNLLVENGITDFSTNDAEEKKEVRPGSFAASHGRIDDRRIFRRTVMVIEQSRNITAK